MPYYYARGEGSKDSLFVFTQFWQRVFRNQRWADGVDLKGTHHSNRIKRTEGLFWPDMRVMKKACCNEDKIEWRVSRCRRNAVSNGRFIGEVKAQAPHLSQRRRRHT